MPRTVLDARKRREILDAARAGESLGKIADRYGVHKATVGRIVQSGQVDIVKVADTRRQEAATAWAAAQRLSLLNQLFDRAAIMAKRIKEPRELQQLASAVAVLIDKRRLEDGLATERTEVHASGASERLAAHVDELATRRQKRDAERPAGAAG